MHGVGRIGVYLNEGEYGSLTISVTHLVYNKELCNYFDRSLHKCGNPDCKFSTASATSSGKSFLFLRKKLLRLAV